MVQLAEEIAAAGGARGEGRGMPRAALLPRILAAAVILLSLLVLCGWQLNVQMLMRISPRFVAMNPATAVAFLLAGVALALRSGGRAGARRLWAIRLLAGAALFLGAAKLMALAGGPDLQLDRLLFCARLDSMGVTQGAAPSFPNRMAPNTAALFVVIGMALLASTSGRLWLRRGAKAVALIAAFAACVAAVGYLNGVASLYQANASIPIALHTIFGFILLAAGILAVDFATARGEEIAAGLSALDAKISVGFGAALFLLAVIGAVSYASIEHVSVAAAASEHTRQETALIAQLEATMADAQTSARGFVISADEGDLALFRTAHEEAARQLETLHMQADGDAEQQSHIAALTPLIAEEFVNLQRVIDTSRAGAATEQQLEAIGQDRKGMDAIHAHLAQMQQNVDAVQMLRSEETGRSSVITRIVITSGSLLAFALVGVAGWLIRRDLQRRQQLDADLRQARQAAEDANESKSQFLANMSHEIRTPMAAIIGYTDLVLDQRQSPSDRLDHINTIRRNGEHLLTIINDILDLSKIEAGKLVVEQLECCPCQILADVASLMRVRAVEKLIRLEVKNEGLVPGTIRTDPARLRQILINLVGNAIKFTEEGWVRLIMRLEEPADGPVRLRFDVIDTGIGMTREQMGRLFQPFVQADDSMTRRFGGTGLGLTISRRLATMLGGQIDVDSSPNRGSTFTLTINPGPLTGVTRLKNCREALAGQSLNQPRDSAAVPLRGRVLLVDDGPDNRRLLSVYLRDAGAEVALAENGRLGCDEALAAEANGQPFGVILMDMQMPELDGYGAAAKLRSKGYTGPIIALTAHAMAEDREKCLRAGCTDYLSKPVRKEDLLKTVAKYLHGAQTAADATAAPAPASTPERVAPPKAPIVSNLTDEGLRTFLNTYVEELPARVAEVEASIARNDLGRLANYVHNLKGTGGLYGLMPITDAAARVERLLIDNAPIDFITAEAQELIALIRRVEGFNARPAPTRQDKPAEA